MAINFSVMCYLPAMNTFAVPCTFYPMNGAPYDARGILSTQELNVIAEDGSIVSTQKTIFDILAYEFSVLPQQRDQVYIPYDCNDAPRGTYEVIDSYDNGGGQTTLTLREMKSPPPLFVVR